MSNTQEPFRLDDKKAKVLVSYLQDKGMNAHMRIIEDIELLEATTIQECSCPPTRYHWDTILFEHMSAQKVCELIDKSFHDKQKRFQSGRNM